MNIEIKKYQKIGISRSQNIKVYKYEEVKDIDDLSKIAPLYEGQVEDAPKEIKEQYYVKVELGNPTIYYI